MTVINTSTASEEALAKDKTVFLGRFDEIFRSSSSMYRGYAERPYNPDLLSNKRGAFGIYDEMRRDDQIKAVLWMKKFMVLSTGWEISVDNDEFDEIASEIKKNLLEIDFPNFGDAISNMLTHLDYGFSITEPVFEISDTGEKLKVKLKSLKTRAPHTFVIHSDDTGEIEKIEQYTNKGFITITHDELKGLMLLIHQYEFGVPYGTSDLQSAYRAWVTKESVIKFWAIYLERFGNPIIVGTVPDVTPQADRDSLISIFENLQAKTGLVVPDGVDIKLLNNIATTGEFERAVNNCNMMISRSMMIPDLIGIGGAEISGGSFSLGRKQFEIFFLTISKIRNDLENIINRYIIAPLVSYNYGITGGEIPKWKLNEMDSDDISLYLKLWLDAIRGNIWKPTDEEINHFRKQIKFPIGDIIRPDPVSWDTGNGMPDNMPKGKGGGADIGGGSGGGGDGSGGGGIPADVLDPTGEEERKEREKERRSEYTKRTQTSYESKIDFSKIEQTEDKNDLESVKILSPIYRKIKEGLIDVVQNKRLIEGRKIGLIPDLKLKYLKDLQIAWRSVLRSTLDLGWESAAKEVKKPKKMASVQNLPMEFEDTLNERSFFITGIERERILKKSRQIIMSGIEKGETTKEVAHKLGQYFEEYEIGASTLETIVKTNTNKVFNMGRRRFFEDPSLDGFVKAYQFSAIIDSRTTPICEKLDREIYAVGDPYIDKITPPLHFNCRSLLVPITEGEDYEVSKQVVKDDDLESFNGLIS